MNAATLRLVYDAGGPPRTEGIALASLDEIEPLLRRLLDERYDGELLLRGHGTARICLFEGSVAWVRSNSHPEHLGDVLRRDMGLPMERLQQAIGHCRTSGQRLGEGMLELGLLTIEELRGCLRRHISDQLLELLEWPGPVVVDRSSWPHRYDRAFTFELDELLRQPTAPTETQRQGLLALMQHCRTRLPQLDLACVIEGEEGTLLCAPSEDPNARDLLGLGVVGIRRLVASRMTRSDGLPTSMVLSSDDTCLVVEPITWRPGWLLVLGGSGAAGRLITVAQAAVRSTS